MIFRETTQDDMDYMKDNSVSRGIMKYQPEFIDYCYSLEHDGKLLGIGGIRMINTSTAWCWIDMTEDAKNHIITVYRVIREWMIELVRQHKLKRLQAYIEPDFPEAIRMAQHLGFEKESILKDFMPDGNALMYVRFF